MGARQLQCVGARQKRCFAGNCTCGKCVPDFILVISSGRLSSTTSKHCWLPLHCAAMLTLCFIIVFWVLYLDSWQVILQHCRLSEQTDYFLPMLISRHKSQHLITHQLPIYTVYVAYMFVYRVCKYSPFKRLAFVSVYCSVWMCGTQCLVIACPEQFAYIC